MGGLEERKGKGEMLYYNQKESRTLTYEENKRSERKIRKHCLFFLHMPGKRKGFCPQEDGLQLLTYHSVHKLEAAGLGFPSRPFHVTILAH